MRFLRGLLWLFTATVVITAAAYVAKRYELTDRLTGLFLRHQPWLPVRLDFEHFLILLVAASFILTLLTFIVCLVVMARLLLQHQRKLGQIAAAKLEVDQVKEQHRNQYEELLLLGQSLAKGLDKRLLAQNIVQAASRLTSVPQANSIVTFWLLHFETETIRFERGLYCDEAMLTKTEFLPTEMPFSRVMTTQQPWLLSQWDEGVALIKRDKSQRLGGATSIMIIPLVIESSVLGVLVIFCHPDILKSYEEQRPYYNAVWGELTLALAIAIQGEVAILDRLTGTHNRTYFMKRLIQEIERANRYQQSVSLLMVDIDNFKQVNDMLGHPQGDAVLRMIANIIKKSVRAIDLVGRYGGEEFVVMLPETGFGAESTSAAGAPFVAERIRKDVDDEFRGLQKPLNLTVSIGVACRRYPEDRETDYQDLIRLADEQLYRAKSSGKNKVCALTSEKVSEPSG